MSLKFTEAERTAIRAEICKGATDSQFELFISEAEARELRPGPHLIFQLRNAKEYDTTLGASIFVKKAYWITTIAALRLIAQRTGQYLGQGAEEYVYLDAGGSPTLKSDIPLPSLINKQIPQEPWVARAKVYRRGFTEPMIGMARFEAYAATVKRNDNGKTEYVLTDVWSKRGPEQLFKCAEALALRKAFPEELGSLYIAEELREESPETVQPTPVTVTPEPVAVPKVNQTPAEPTTAPRPGETINAVPQTATAVVTTGGAGLETKTETVKVELPEAKKKRGPKAKSPVNGPEQGITEEDIASAGTPAPVGPTEEDKAAAEEFVAGLDPTPTKEEMGGFGARVRALVAAGAANVEIKDYILQYGGKTETKDLTVRDWTGSLEQLETAHKENRLKEEVKNE